MESGSLTSIIVIIFLLICFAVVVYVYVTVSIPLMKGPERHERAEVIGKREAYSAGSEENRYFVSCKFDDGSVKELRVGADKAGRKAYDSFREGCPGILVYKQIKSLTFFIRFEDDCDYVNHNGRGS